MKHLKLLEAVKTGVNKNMETSTKLVKVVYNGVPMIAVAICFASGPYYMEKYYLLQDENMGLENKDFDSVTDIDPSELLNSGI